MALSTVTLFATITTTGPSFCSTFFFLMALTSTPQINNMYMVYWVSLLCKSHEVRIWSGPLPPMHGRVSGPDVLNKASNKWRNNGSAYWAHHCARRVLYIKRLRHVPGAFVRHSRSLWVAFIPLHLVWVCKLCGHEHAVVSTGGSVLLYFFQVLSSGS